MKTSLAFGTPLAVSGHVSADTTWSDSTIYQVVVPTDPPTVTKEPWQCATENLTQYFDVPLPTGSLGSALQSYANSLVDDCTATGADRVYGCFPPKAFWCAFPTAVPSVASAWSSFGNVASAWWASHSSAAVFLAQKCPEAWYDASFEYFGGPTLLNRTLVLAACHVEALATSGSGAGLAAPSAATGSPATPASGPSSASTPAPTVAENSVLGRAEGVEMWLMAGTWFAAATVDALL